MSCFAKCIVTLLFLVTTSLKAQEVLNVSSPDGKIHGEFMLQDGKVSWKVDQRFLCLWASGGVALRLVKK